MIQHPQRVRDAVKPSVHIQEFGSGDPLLILHGAAPGASGLGNFGQNIEALSAAHRVLLADLPGFGGSAALPEATGGDYRQMAELMVKELEHRGAFGAHVLGMATGAGIALAMGALSPHAVGKLILVGPPGGRSLLSPSPSEGSVAMNGYFSGSGPSRERMRAYLELTVADRNLITEDIVDSRYAESMKEHEAILAGRGRRKASTAELLGYGSQVSAETLIIWGMHNRIQPASNAFEFLHAIRRSQLHIYRDAGLWVPFEKKSDFERMVLSFLGQ